MSSPRASATAETAAGRPVREMPRPGEVPIVVHPEWRDRFPWLVQGTTWRGDADEPFDLGLFRDAPVGSVVARWRRLREATGMPRAVHARQVHGARLLRHEHAAPGLFLADDADAHATRAPGILLTISVADCVPIFIVDPDRRAIALLHGGWRGTAAGVLGAGIAALADLAGSDAASLHVHVGPAICGDCYEVGPEVHEALGLEPPATNTPVDLRAVLARQARDLGVPAEQISRSEHCTRCGDRFFSHRAGSTGRQLGLLGLRAD